MVVSLVTLLYPCFLFKHVDLLTLIGSFLWSAFLSNLLVHFTRLCYNDSILFTDFSATITNKEHTGAETAWIYFVFLSEYRLVGLVVRRPPRERKIPGSNPACDGIFSWSSHTSDSKIGTPVATLPGAWRYRVSTGLVGPVSVYCDWVR